FLHSSADHPHLHSFPTRRSSDLSSLIESPTCMTPPWRIFARRPPFPTKNFKTWRYVLFAKRSHGSQSAKPSNRARPTVKRLPQRDRKSTRLNSSHVSISYAVFCL